MRWKTVLALSILILLVSGCIEPAGEPQIWKVDMEIFQVNVTEHEHPVEWTVDSIVISLKNVGIESTVRLTFDVFLIKDDTIVDHQLDLDFLKLGFGEQENKTLSTFLLDVDEPGIYTLKIETHEFGSARVLGSASKTVLVGTRTGGTEKRASVFIQNVEIEKYEMPDRWVIKSIAVSMENVGDVTIHSTVVDISLLSDYGDVFQMTDGRSFYEPIKVGETAHNTISMYKIVGGPGSYTLKVDVRIEEQIIGSATKIVLLS